MNKYDSYFEANKDLWNAKADLHYRSEFYDMEAFRINLNSLNEIELGLIGDVSGRSILHLQCHFGQDSLSLAKLGAKVTGVDFSEKAIEIANSLAVEMDLDATFVCSDVYNLPDRLKGRFDMVYITYGAIPWLPDMEKYAAVVSHFLRGGGELVLVEFHPFLYTYDFEKKRLEYLYCNHGKVIEEEVTSTYASGDEHGPMKEFSWIHPLSTVIQAFLDNGMELQHFAEYDYSPYNCFSNMEEVAPGRYRFDPDRIGLPQVFSLRMRKRGG